jgi:hypothetical protein
VFYPPVTQGHTPSDPTGGGEVNVSLRWFMASITSYCLWLLLNVTFAMAMLVDLVFWVFLFPVSIAVCYRMESNRIAHHLLQWLTGRFI